MRYIEKLDAQNPTITPSLDWYADTVSVINPTQNIILIRAGASDIPSSPLSSDVWVPPYTAQSFPVDAREFGIGMGGISLAAPVFNSLFPQSVTVLFTAGETPPTFTAMALGNVSAGQQNIGTSAARTIPGSYTDEWAILPGIRTLTFSRLGNSITSLWVRGKTTGRTYWYNTSGTLIQYGANGLPPRLVFGVNPDADPVVAIDIVTNGLGGALEQGYTLAGYQEVYRDNTAGADGRQSVTAIEPSLGYVPVGPPPGLIYVPVGISNLMRVPSYEAYNQGAGRANFSTLVTLTFAAGGIYRIEGELSTTEPAASTAVIDIQHKRGASTLHQAVCPGPGQKNIAWGARQYNAGDTLISTVGFTTAASVYWATIRAYLAT